MPIKQMSLAQIKDFIKPPATRGIEEVVLHHFWSPTLAQYHGLSTWESVNYWHGPGHNKWTPRGPEGDKLTIGYHFGADHQGRYWKCRDYRYRGCHVLNRNTHSIGVAMPGNFDVEDPTNSLHAAAKLVRALVDRFKLAAHNIRFHREFENKPCPGLKVSLAAFREMVMGSPQGDVADPWPDIPALAVVLGGKVIDCKPKLVEGRLAVMAHPFSTALNVVWPAVTPDFVHQSGYIFVAEAQPFFEAQGWVIDGRVWHTEALGDGMVVKRLYPKRKEWMTP